MTEDIGGYASWSVDDRGLHWRGDFWSVEELADLLSGEDEARIPVDDVRVLLSSFRPVRPRKEPTVHLVGPRGWAWCGQIRASDTRATNDPASANCRSCERSRKAAGPSPLIVRRDRKGRR